MKGSDMSKDRDTSNTGGGLPSWCKTKPASDKAGRPGQPGAGERMTFETGRRAFMGALDYPPGANVKRAKGRKSTTKEAYED
jgi:hypothetical protein